MVEKYVCLFMESWTCPVMKRLKLKADDISGTALQVGDTLIEGFVEFCKICPHRK